MFPVAMTVDKRHLPYVHRLGMAINQRLATPAMGGDPAHRRLPGGRGRRARQRVRRPWGSATFAILIVLGGLVGGYFVPTDRRLAEMAERDLASESGELSEEYQRGARTIGMVGGLAGVLVLVAILLMVTKPGPSLGPPISAARWCRRTSISS